MKFILNQPPYKYEKSAYKMADEQIDTLVDDGKYEQALEILQNLKVTMPYRNADNFDYRIWIFNELNQFDNKMAELIDAAKNNVFFPLDVDGYSNGIKQHVDFDNLRQRNRLALDEMRSEVVPELELYLPDGEANGELFLILHGNAQFNESIIEQWPPNAYLDSGFSVAYLQSPQVFCSDGYYWTDHYPQNRLVLKQAFELIESKLKIAAEKITLAGFSGGAMVSMSAVTHGVVKPKQILAFMPHSGDYIGKEQCLDMPVTIFKAEFDANIDALFDALKPVANAKQVMLKGLDHALPPDMASYVLPYLNKPD